MCLETLNGVSEIGGFKVCHKYLNGESIAMVGIDQYIEVDHEDNSISFTIQDDPVKEKGLNGCQVLTMIQTAKLIIEKLNEKFPCVYNSNTIARLNEAIEWQEMRTKDREKRNVEGTNQV